MKLRVLGCDGGRSVGYNNTSFLFNDNVMVDAGTIQSQLSIEEAMAVTDIFITHSHLDHILDLPFLLDATFEKRAKPLTVHGTKETLDAIMEHIFNNKIWPDFSELPSKDKGQFKLNYIEPNKANTVNGLTFTPIQVNHTVPTVGYKIEDENSALIFSGDTGPIDSLWEVANNTPNLVAIIIDLSFPNDEQYIADLSKHMTADNVGVELKKLNKDCDVYAFHYKVGMGSILDSQSKEICHFGKPIKALNNYKEIII